MHIVYVYMFSLFILIFLIFLIFLEITVRNQDASILPFIMWEIILAALDEKTIVKYVECFFFFFFLFFFTLSFLLNFNRSIRGVCTLFYCYSEPFFDRLFSGMC